MKHDLQQILKKIKQQWGLAEDIGMQDLLQRLEYERKQQPDDPELAYLHAELLRKAGETQKATQAYQQVVDISHQRTQQRGDKLIYRVVQRHQELRKKLLFLALIPVLLLAMLGTYYWYENHQLEVLKQQDGDPNEFAFTHWLAKQQAAQIVSNLQKANPNLSFDFGSNARQSPQDPMAFMESLMGEDMQRRLRRGDDGNGDGKGDGNDENGKPIFKCDYDRQVAQCDPGDVPSAPGVQRLEVVTLMNAYRSILNTEKDCEKLERSIEQIGEQLKWRKSEKSIKADMEDFAIECFYRQNNHEKVIEHARKLQCTGETNYINSVYWYLTASMHQSGQKEKARDMYQCFNKAIEYKETFDFDAASIAARHRESGALAWLYFDDLDSAVSELEKARETIKKSTSKSQMLSYVASEIDLDLMETYVTANIDLETFEQLHFDINSSGFLTDGYKQIKDTLASIYYMQNGKKQLAKSSLNNVTERFKQMPEYICSWDWSGFQRSLGTSIKNKSTREMANSLVVATDCYVPQSSSERIKKINTVIQGLDK